MSELSREQRDRILHAARSHFTKDELLVTVGDMIADARAEGAATALREASDWWATDPELRWSAGTVAAWLAARASSDAAGAPLSASETSAGAGVPDEAAGAAEGRTEPHIVTHALGAGLVLRHPSQQPCELCETR